MTFSEIPTYSIDTFQHTETYVMAISSILLHNTKTASF